VVAPSPNAIKDSIARDLVGSPLGKRVYLHLSVKEDRGKGLKPLKTKTTRQEDRVKDSIPLDAVVTFDYKERREFKNLQGQESYRGIVTFAARDLDGLQVGHDDLTNKRFSDELDSYILGNLTSFEFFGGEFIGLISYSFEKVHV